MTLFPYWNPHYPQPDKPPTPAPPSSAPSDDPVNVTLADGLILRASPDELLHLSPSLQAKIRTMHEKQKNSR